MKYMYVYARTKKSKEYLLSIKGISLINESDLNDDKIWIFEISMADYFKLSEKQISEIKRLKCTISNKLRLEF